MLPRNWCDSPSRPACFFLLLLTAISPPSPVRHPPALFTLLLASRPLLDYRPLPIGWSVVFLSVSTTSSVPPPLLLCRSASRVHVFLPPLGMEHIKIPSPSAILDSPPSVGSSRPPAPATPKRAALHAANPTNKLKQSKSRNGTVSPFFRTMSATQETGG